MITNLFPVILQMLVGCEYVSHMKTTQTSHDSYYLANTRTDVSDSDKTSNVLN